MEEDYETTAGQQEHEGEEDGTEEGRNENEDNDVNPKSEDEDKTGTSGEESPDSTSPISPTLPTTEDSITFTGDDETVEVHKTHDDKHRTPSSSPLTPDICEGNFDAIAVLRGELFIFKQKVASLF